MQIVKIHPSSSLADKKVPAIIYDELVRPRHDPALPVWALNGRIGVYHSHIRARRLRRTKELHRRGPGPEAAHGLGPRRVRDYTCEGSRYISV